MAQELPFLSFTEEDIKSLNPVNVECMVRCEIAGVSFKPTDKGGTYTYRFTVIDENSPEFGKPAFRSFPANWPTMHIPLLAAALQMETSEFKAGKLNPGDAKGKTCIVRFKLGPDGQNGFKVQPTEFFRDDRPLV